MTVKIKSKEVVKKPLYTITGILRNGRRFKAFSTHTPRHYNIWQGSLWKNLDNGKRKLVKRY